ncbi:hypothetical protein OG884_05740 [Streptosporangium sp. NBC_01755]|uniref:hypothetical protein n=1 Tax=Streptosporangium sp. NBC_01755 TaxID=2975949 RepID=UPI002DDA48C3|nr:hypothetical protein [Streptosporangium sp. NBC_01755]WSD01427.1 hypothetical protein OG884_05740 [Streptosporangium sp. NBC_01755]
MSPTADRSVTVRLSADVKPFITAMAKAEAAAKKLRDGLGDSWEPFGKETQKQRTRAPRQAEEVAGAFTRSFSRSLESAFKALPKAEITADSTDAQIKLGSLRQAMQDLSGKTIGVDINAASALGELRAIQGELDRLGTSADIDVRADASAALAQLQSVQREVDRLGGETARVNVDADTGGALSRLAAVGAEVSRLNGRNARVRVTADVSSALTGIAMVGAALASLPAATSIAVGVGALGSAFTAAGIGAAGFAAVAVPGMTRVNEALAAQESAAKAAGGATGGAGQSAAQAAQQMLQMEAAQKRLKDAQVDARQAQRDLTAAWEEGRRSLQDLNFNLDQSILSQEDAALAVREAAQRLAEVNADPNADQLDRERAELSYRQALQRSEEQEVKTARARKDTAAANKAGVKGTEEYTSAQENLKDAQAEVAEAEQQLKLLRLQQQEAMAGAGGSAGGLADAFAKLSKQEKTLAGDVKAFNKAYLDWQRDLQPDVFPVISKGLDLLTVGMNKATPLIRTSAGAFGELIDKTKEGLEGEQWTSFFYDLTTQAPRAIEGLGTAAGNVAGGLAGIIQAFLPYTGDLMTWIENVSQEFEDWGQGLQTSEGFKSFVAYAQENLPKVGEVVGNLGIAIGKILEAGAGPGAGALDFLVTLSEKLAGMSPEQVEAIAKGVAAIFAAIKLGTSLQVGAFVLLAEVLGQMSPGQIQGVALAIAGLVVAVKGYQAASAAIGFWKSLGGGIGAAGDAANGAKGKFAALGKAALGIGVSVVALEGVGSAINSLAGQSKGADKLTLALTELGQTGKWAGDLSDQWAGGFHSADEAAALFRDGLKELQDPSLFQTVVEHPFTELSAVLPGIDSAVDRVEQKFSDMDATLAGMVSSGNLDGANAAFARLKDEAVKAGVPVEKLQELFPTYAQAVRVAGTASSEAAVGIDAAKQGLDGFQSSLDTFNATTDAAKAIREMDLAYQSAKKAVDASAVGLEIHKAKTDEQRDAAILARDAFSGYIEKVDGIGRAQQVAGKNTADSTLSIAEQLPKLFDLAGSSKEAQARVYDLAKNFGISREMADKARTGSKEFKEELERLKDKKVKIELETKEALEKAYAFAKQLLGIKLELPIGIRAPATPKAYGGISHADGRQYMASGGIRSVGSNPAAMIARSPALISGRGGPDVVFGEAGWEAFIPLDPGKRGRGLQVLGEAASAMGMAVVPQQTAVNTAGGSMAGGGGIPLPAGGAMVTVTGIGALRSSLDTTTMDLTAGLGGATSTLDATLGDAGTLTQSLAGVGEVAGHLAGEVTGWGEVIAVQVPPLTDAVTLLGEAISAAASAADAKGNAGSKGDERSPRGGSSSKGSTGSKGDERSPRGGTALSAVRSTQALKQPPPTEIKGAARGTAGVAMSGGSVNWSRVSKPVQSSPSWSSSGSSAAPSGQAGQGGSSGGSSGGGPLVALNGMTVRSEADIDQFAAQVAMRISGRG